MDTFEDYLNDDYLNIFRLFQLNTSPSDFFYTTYSSNPAIF